MNQQNNTKLVLAITLIIGFFYGSTRYFSLKSQQLKNEAVNGCMIASGVYEYINATEGVKTTAPQKEYYRVCLTDKGYTTSWE